MGYNPQKKDNGKDAKAAKRLRMPPEAQRIANGAKGKNGNPDPIRKQSPRQAIKASRRSARDERDRNTGW